MLYKASRNLIIAHGEYPRNLSVWCQMGTHFHLSRNEIFFCLEKHTNFSKENYNLLKVLNLEGKIGYTVIRQKDEQHWAIEI